jgi:hypothetical protein
LTRLIGQSTGDRNRDPVDFKQARLEQVAGQAAEQNSCENLMAIIAHNKTRDTFLFIRMSHLLYYKFIKGVNLLFFNMFIHFNYD